MIARLRSGTGIFYFLNHKVKLISKTGQKHIQCYKNSEMRDLSTLSHKLHEWSFLLYQH